MRLGDSDPQCFIVLSGNCAYGNRGVDKGTGDKGENT